MFATSLTKLLNVTYPIIQAPIGSAATPELVAAVSNSGGLGTLALTWKDLDTTSEMICRVKKLTDKPFAVNLILQFEQRERIQICVDEHVPILTFAWGDPSDHMELLKKKGVIVGQTVGSSDEAELFEKAGLDFLIAQGWEAGGHLIGNVASSVLVPSIKSRVNLPVVAAGGIANGTGILAALSSGADGVSLGTRFLLSKQAMTHPLFKRLLIDASENDTMYCADLFNIGWENAPHRVIKNSTVKVWDSAGRPAPGNRPAEGQIIAYQQNDQPIPRYSDYFPLQGMLGNLEGLALYAGQSVGLINDEQDANLIMESLVSEILIAYEALKKKFITHDEREGTI